MKRIILVLIALMMIVSGCGKKGQDIAQNSGQQTEQEQQGTTSNEENAAEEAAPLADAPIVTEDKQIGDYTTEFISKYIDSGMYYLKTNVTEKGETKSIEIAVSGEKAALKDESGVKIIDGDKLFFVLHEQKAVITSPVAESMKEGFSNFILEKQVSGVREMLVSTGTEEINGQQLSMEEFKNGDMTLKYYYDNKTIRYVKQITADGTEKLTEVLELTHNVPQDIFTVPADYMVQDLSALQ